MYNQIVLFTYLAPLVNNLDVTLFAQKNLYGLYFTLLVLFSGMSLYVVNLARTLYFMVVIVRGVYCIYVCLSVYMLSSTSD